MPVDRSKFVTSKPLSNVAFDYFMAEDTFIAKDALTVLPVEKGTTKVSQIDASKLRPVDDEKGTNSEANIIDEQLFEREIKLSEFKLARDINPRDVRDADIPALLDETRATKVVMESLLLKMEIRAASLVLTSSNYATANTSALSSGSKWNEAGGSPESDLLTVNEALRNGCGRKANALIIEELTLGKLRLSPEWRTRTQYTNGGPIPVELIKAFLEVDFLFVGKARYDNAIMGAARSMSKVWGGDDVCFFHHDPSVSLESQNPFKLFMVNPGFDTAVIELPTRRGVSGSMRRVQVAAEYAAEKGMVESSSSSKFVSAYLLRDVVA